MPLWRARVLAAKQFGLEVCRRVLKRFQFYTLSRKLGASCAMVQNEQKQIAGLMDDLEKRFLDIGNDLEQVSEASELLVAVSEEFLRLAAGQIDGTDQFKNAAENLRAPLEFLREYQSWSTELGCELRLRRDQIAQICNLESEIESLLIPLRYIQVLFRIEAARLPVEVQNVFVTLTCDIEQIHSKAVESVKTEFSRLEGALEIIDKLIQKLDLQAKTNSNILNQKQAAIEQSLRELGLSISESQNRDVRLNRTVQAIHTEVGQVITGIQFQDITRQKLQAVDGALTNLTGRMAELGGAFRFLSAKRKESLGRIHEIAKVQRSQVGAIDSDLESAQATMNGALGSILEKIKNLDQDYITLQSLPSVANADNGMVQVMLNATAEVRTLIRGAECLESEIYDAINPLSGLASNLTAIVRQLSFDIKLIALNAQIQAAHLDSGTGLEVLSQKTCVISVGVNAVNEQSGSQLDQVAETLRNVVDHCRRYREQAQQQRQFLEGEGVEVERQLHVFRDRVLQVFNSVNERSAEFRGRIEETMKLTGFHPLAAPRLAAAKNDLDWLATLTEPWKDAAPKVDDATLDQQLRTDYRMSSQRQTHLEAIEKSISNPIPKAAPEAIEWFEGSAQTAIEPDDKSQPTPNGRQTDEPVVADPGNKKGDLGANVELF